MEHAARYHIGVHFDEDPAYYKKLSERLEEILEKFEDNWDELVAALRKFTEEVRAGTTVRRDEPGSEDAGAFPESAR